MFKYLIIIYNSNGDNNDSIYPALGNNERKRYYDIRSHKQTLIREIQIKYRPETGITKPNSGNITLRRTAPKRCRKS